MDLPGCRTNFTSRWIGIGSTVVACFTVGACGWMPKFSSSEPKAATSEPKTAAPVQMQTADHGLGRDVMRSSDDTRNVVSIVSQSKYGYVRIERAEPAAQGPNDHPASLAAAQVRSMLGKLKVRRGGSDADAIFTEDELNELSAGLAEALAKAGPREDVVFAMHDRHGGTLGWFLPRTVTAGRAFYKSGALNVIFGEIHGQFEDQYLATGWLRPFVAGSRSGKGAGEWTVTSAEPLLYASAGRPDWIQLAEGAAAAPAASPASPASPPPAPIAAPRPASPGPAVAPASSPPAATPPSPARAATPASPAPVVVPNRDNFYQDLEKRLSVLRGLRDKGLITEEEFNEKRKAILREL
jgi:hypothetical protein